MREEDMIFIIVVTLISGGLFLIFMKMVLNFFMERRKGKGASMGTSELETMIQRAVEGGTASLHDRLDDLEQRLDDVGEKLEARPKALPEAQPSALFRNDIESALPAQVPEERRSDR